MDGNDLANAVRVCAIALIVFGMVIGATIAGSIWLLLSWTL